MVPETRVRILNPADVNPNGEFVLYWMIAARRLGWNFALDRAVDLATALGKPLVIVEALRCDYPHASDRLHRFVLDGMADNRRIASRTAALYYPYVEPDAGAARGLLDGALRRACVVVTDWYPAFFLPRMLSRRGDEGRRAARGRSTRTASSRSRRHGRAFTAARFYRAFMQRTSATHLTGVPARRTPRPAAAPAASAKLPADDRRQMAGRQATRCSLATRPLAALPIDHDVPPVDDGGRQRRQRARRCQTFVDDQAGPLRRRSQPSRRRRDEPAVALPAFRAPLGHEVFAAVMTHERWTTRKLEPSRAGAREGWWGVSPVGRRVPRSARRLARARLQQLRVRSRTTTSYESCPSGRARRWRRTARDPRPHLYTLEQLEAARDRRSRLERGAAPASSAKAGSTATCGCCGERRSSSGRKTPEEALERMQHPDGPLLARRPRPELVRGLRWVLGRYDRPWPEREIFGTRPLHDVSQRRAQAQTDEVSRNTGSAVGSRLAACGLPDTTRAPGTQRSLLRSTSPGNASVNLPSRRSARR